MRETLGARKSCPTILASQTTGALGGKRQFGACSPSPRLRGLVTFLDRAAEGFHGPGGERFVGVRSLFLRTFLEDCQRRRRQRKRRCPKIERAPVSIGYIVVVPATRKRRHEDVPKIRARDVGEDRPNVG